MEDERNCLKYICRADNIYHSISDRWRVIQHHRGVISSSVSSTPSQLTFHSSSYFTQHSPPLGLLGLVFCQSEMLLAVGAPLNRKSHPDGLTGQSSKLTRLNFTPEKFALRNVRHLRLLDYNIGVPYL